MIVIGVRGWRLDAGLTNQCLNKEVLEEIVEMGKLWNTWAGAVFICKEDHDREVLPRIEAEIGPDYCTCENIVDTRMCLEWLQPITMCYGRWGD